MRDTLRFGSTSSAPSGDEFARKWEVTGAVPHAPRDLAFRRFYRDHVAFVLQAARLCGAGEGHLEDVVQEVFIVTYRKLDPLEGPGTRAWLFATTRFLALRSRRTESRLARRRSALTRVLRARGEDRAADSFEARRAVCRVLDSLGEAQRSVLVGVELLGMTAAELGEALGLSANTVSSRLRLARARVATLAEEDRREAQDLARPPDERMSSTIWVGICGRLGFAGAGKVASSMAFGAALAGAAAAIAVTVGTVALHGRAEPPHPAAIASGHAPAAGTLGGTSQVADPRGTEHQASATAARRSNQDASGEPAIDPSANARGASEPSAAVHSEQAARSPVPVADASQNVAGSEAEDPRPRDEASSHTAATPSSASVDRPAPRAQAAPPNPRALALQARRADPVRAEGHAPPRPARRHVDLGAEPPSARLDATRTRANAASADRPADSPSRVILLPPATTQTDAVAPKQPYSAPLRTAIPLALGTAMVRAARNAAR